MRTSKELVVIAFLSAFLVIGKEMLAFLPNVELVSFLLILYTHHYPLKTVMLIAAVFCMIQIILYGFGDWSLMYFIVWEGLVIISSCLKRKLYKAEQLAFFSGLFGLCFGAFFALPYLVFSFQAAFAYWLKGIYFDLIHALSNYLVMLLLYDRVHQWMENYLDKT